MMIRPSTSSVDPRTQVEEGIPGGMASSAMGHGGKSSSTMVAPTRGDEVEDATKRMLDSLKQRGELEDLSKTLRAELAARESAIEASEEAKARLLSLIQFAQNELTRLSTVGPSQTESDERHTVMEKVASIEANDVPKTVVDPVVIGEKSREKTEPKGERLEKAARTSQSAQKAADKLMMLKRRRAEAAKKEAPIAINSTTNNSAGASTTTSRFVVPAAGRKQEAAKVPEQQVERPVARLPPQEAPVLKEEPREEKIPEEPLWAEMTIDDAMRVEFARYQSRFGVGDLAGKNGKYKIGKHRIFVRFDDAKNLTVRQGGSYVGFKEWVEATFPAGGEEEAFEIPLADAYKRV